MRPCRRVHRYADHGTVELNLDSAPDPPSTLDGGKVPSAAGLILMPAASERVAPVRLPSPAAPCPSTGTPPRPDPPRVDARRGDFLLSEEQDPDEAILPTLPVGLDMVLRALQAESRRLEGWLERSAARVANRPSTGSILTKVEAVQDALAYLAAAECHVRAARQRLGDLPAGRPKPRR